MRRLSRRQKAAAALGEWLTRLAISALRLLAKLPYGALRRIGEACGDLAWLLAGSRRRVALVNLRLCFPDWSEDRRRAVARGHFRCLMRSLFDRFVFWYEPAERTRELVTVRGLAHFLAHQGRPVIMLGPHFVGIDAGGMRFQLDYPAGFMYAKQKSAALSAAMTRGRMRYGRARTFLRNEGLRGPIRAIREGTPLYLLPDMDLGARDAVFVPFFGVPAATVTSVARLAKITGALVIPLVTRMTDRGYEVQLYPAWEDYPGEDLVVAARRMNEFIEQRVLEMPEQYLWSHKRFKTRPPGSPNPYR